jgi:hypothetical protein
MLPQVHDRVGLGDGDLPQALLKFIANFAMGPRHESILPEIARALVKAAHAPETAFIEKKSSG